MFNTCCDGRWLKYNELLAGFRSRYDFLYPYLSLTDGTKNDLSGKFICDTWALLKKKIKIILNNNITQVYF